MIKTFFRQAIIVAIIIGIIIFLQSLQISYINMGLQKLEEAISKNYTVKDIGAFGYKTVTNVKDMSTKVVSAIAQTQAIQEYGEPIDEVREEITPIYAVAPGTVILTGENGEIGKFARIAHDNNSESVYGQCNEVYVEPLERVRKGQIIGSYRQVIDKDFYYKLYTEN